MNRDKVPGVISAAILLARAVAEVFFLAFKLALDDERDNEPHLSAFTQRFSTHLSRMSDDGTFKKILEDVFFNRERAPKLRLPGYSLRGWAERIVSPSTYTFVLEPTLSDLVEEHALALAEDRPWKARWVRLRGYGSFWMAAAAHLGAVVSRQVARFWARS